jgi:hypothetical protein
MAGETADIVELIELLADTVAGRSIRVWGNRSLTRPCDPSLHVPFNKSVMTKHLRLDSSEQDQQVFGTPDIVTHTVKTNDEVALPGDQFLCRRQMRRG